MSPYSKMARYTFWVHVQRSLQPVAATNEDYAVYSVGMTDDWCWTCCIDDWRSLDDDSVATLATLESGAASTTFCSTGRGFEEMTDKLQRVLCGSYQTVTNTSDDWPTSGAMFHTGSTSLTGSGSGCASQGASRCTSASTAWLTSSRFVGTLAYNLT